MDSTSSDADFDRNLQELLDADMPARHGLSPEAYAARCRELWDACETNETYPTKMLSDRLFMAAFEIGEIAGRSGITYMDPRARAATDVEPPPNDPIYCRAYRLAPLSEFIRNEDMTSPEPLIMQDFTRAGEFSLYILAVIDVLGFERMYRRIGPQRTRDAYAQLIKVAQGLIKTTAIAITPNLFSDGSCPQLFSFNLGFSHSSDTLLLWAPLDDKHVSPFLTRCADVFLEALSMGIPLRGAISVGEAILDNENGVFLGTPLIDAARLEHAQDWLGIALTKGWGPDVYSWLDSSLVIPYTPPCKPDTRDDLLSGFVIDWPRRARLRNIDASAELDAMKPPKSHRSYYDHTHKFIEHSALNEHWNRDNHIPISIPFLKRSIIQTRLDDAPVPPEALAMLDSMALNGGEETAIANCLRTILEGGSCGSNVEALPQGPRNFICELDEIITKQLIDLEEVAIAVLEQRHGVNTLSKRHREYLADVPTNRNAKWKECIPFFSVIANGAEVPTVPINLPPDIDKLLCETRDAALGLREPIDMNALISGVLFAATDPRSALSDTNIRRLDALAAVGSPWDSVAVFLRDVVKGHNPEFELHSLDESAISWIDIIRKSLSWQSAVRRSLTDAVKSIERINVGLLVEVALQVVGVVRGEDWRDESWGVLTDQLTRLEISGFPNDAVARYLRSLLANRCPPIISGGAGADVISYELIISLFALHLDPGSSIVKLLPNIATEVRIARRIPTPYEQAIFLFLDHMIPDAGRVFVRYLWAFATSKYLPPIPSDINPIFKQLLEELQKTARASRPVFSLQNKAKAALRYRHLSCGSKFAKSLRASIEAGGDEGQIAVFLLGVIELESLPGLPDQLDDETRQILVETGVEALCAPLNLSDLTRAVFMNRCYAHPLIDSELKALAALSSSGEPLGSIGRFLSEVAICTHLPTIPEGIPRLTLSLLCSLLNQVSVFSREVLLLSRREPSDQ